MLFLQFFNQSFTVTFYVNTYHIKCLKIYQYFQNVKGYFEIREIERWSILNKKTQDGACYNKTYELDIYKKFKVPLSAIF